MFYLLAVRSNETTADFDFVFKSIKEAVYKIFHKEVHIDTLISDAEKSIKNGFENVFGAENPTIIICWVLHMRKNVLRKAQKMIKNKANDAMQDIDFIQVLNEETTFLEAMVLFLKKMGNGSIFFNYLRQEGFDQNRNWYEGAKLRTPNTNNAL